MCAEVYLPKNNGYLLKTQSMLNDFIQHSEMDPANTVICHNISPSMSSFFGGLHPQACLYEDTPEEEKLNSNFNNLVDTLKSYGI
jgi:hypothetical protein